MCVRVEHCLLSDVKVMKRSYTLVIPLFVSKTVYGWRVWDILVKRVSFGSATFVRNVFRPDKCSASYCPNRTPKGFQDDERPGTCGRNVADTLGKLSCKQTLRLRARLSQSFVCLLDMVALQKKSCHIALLPHSDYTLCDGPAPLDEAHCFIFGV